MCNEPLQTPSVPILYCSLWAHMKYFKNMHRARVHVQPPLILLSTYVIVLCNYRNDVIIAVINIIVIMIIIFSML